jgi:hypothetical protein
LRRMIEAQSTKKRATVGDVELFVLADTAFHAGHYKSVLREMERRGRLIPINPPPKRRRGTYPDAGLILDFA